MKASEKDKFRDAERLWQAGNEEPAIALHRELAKTARDDRVRLQSCLVLMDRLKPLDHFEVILEATAVGLDAARRVGEQLLAACIMARRAEALVTLNGIAFIPRRRQLNMAPGWFEFSLEDDKAQFEMLTGEITKNDSEADRLLKEGIEIAQRFNSASTRGHVLVCAGRVESNRYMSLKMELQRAERRFPTAIIRRLRPYRLDEFVLYTRDERERMEGSVRACESCYLDAGKAFIEAGDEGQVAYVYFNLANDLRSAFRFRKAKMYLSQSKQLAEGHRNDNLLRQVRALEQSIVARNRDTPNYVAGERRKPLES